MKNNDVSSNILLLGDSHIACLSNAFHKLSIRHDSFSVGGSLLGRGRFRLCDEYIWRFEDRDIQESWKRCYVNSFLNQRTPREDQRRIIVTNLPIGSVTLKQQVSKFFDYDIRKIESAGVWDWHLCFESIRSKHVDILRRFRMYCDRLILVYPPGVEGGNQDEGIMRGKLYGYLDFIHAGEGWRILNTPQLLMDISKAKKMGFSIKKKSR